MGYKEDVRKRIRVDPSEEESLIYSRYVTKVTYKVILEPPEEGFFKGAKKKLAEAIRERTRQELGQVEVYLIPLRIFKTKDLAIYSILHEKGRQENEMVAVVEEFHPLIKMDVAVGVESKFKGRGVGGHVLAEVAKDLKKRHVEVVVVTIVSTDLEPVLIKYGYEQIPDSRDFFKIYG